MESEIYICDDCGRVGKENCRKKEYEEEFGFGFQLFPPSVLCDDCYKSFMEMEFINLIKSNLIKS